MDWKIISATFVLVFSRSLGDKTQLMVFARSAETGARRRRCSSARARRYCEHAAGRPLWAARLDGCRTGS